MARAVLAAAVVALIEGGPVRQAILADLFALYL
jgi:hypothetical protein